MTHQVVSVRTYVGVFVALIALTVTTVAVSKIELGEYNFIAAMTIAVIKGSLVVRFFMDVSRSSSLTQLLSVPGSSGWRSCSCFAERLHQPRLAAGRKMVALIIALAETSPIAYAHPVRRVCFNGRGPATLAFAMPQTFRYAA